MSDTVVEAATTSLQHVRFYGVGGGRVAVVLFLSKKSRPPSINFGRRKYSILIYIIQYINSIVIQQYLNHIQYYSPGTAYVVVEVVQYFCFII